MSHETELHDALDNLEILDLIDALTNLDDKVYLRTPAQDRPRLIEKRFIDFWRGVKAYREELPLMPPRRIA